MDQYLAGGQADLLAKLINGGFAIETFFISLRYCNSFKAYISTHKLSTVDFDELNFNCARAIDFLVIGDQTAEVTVPTSSFLL